VTEEWKVSRGGRHWFARFEPDAWVLVGLVRNDWPDDGVITIEHVAPHGCYDANLDLSVDGHLIERWEWRPGDQEPTKIE
jgi:hypothetical protein